MDGRVRRTFVDGMTIYLHERRWEDPIFYYAVVANCAAKGDIVEIYVAL